MMDPSGAGVTISVSLINLQLLGETQLKKLIVFTFVTLNVGIYCSTISLTFVRMVNLVLTERTPMPLVL